MEIFIIQVHPFQGKAFHEAQQILIDNSNLIDLKLEIPYKSLPLTPRNSEPAINGLYRYFSSGKIPSNSGYPTSLVK